MRSGYEGVCAGPGPGGWWVKGEGAGGEPPCEGGGMGVEGEGKWVGAGGAARRWEKRVAWKWVRERRDVRAVGRRRCVERRLLTERMWKIVN